MRWNQTSPMDQKTPFIADYLRQNLSFEELCELYGISRKTGHKWVNRYLTHGAAGLEDQPQWPRSSPRATPEHMVAARLEARQRHGLVPKQRKRRRIGHPGRPTTWCYAPNELWAADFKGEFKTGDGRYCHPLTITDGYSRFLLACQGLHSTAVHLATPVFTRVFTEFGLPQRIRTDNGVPFATTTLARLFRHSAWWVRLGAQQRNFNTFREEFNHVRPHIVVGDCYLCHPTNGLPIFSSAQHRRLMKNRRDAFAARVCPAAAAHLQW